MSLKFTFSAGYYRELPHTAHPYAITESGGPAAGGHRSHRPPPSSSRVPLSQASMGASQLGYPSTQGSQGGYGFSQDSLNLG